MSNNLTNPALGACKQISQLIWQVFNLASNLHDPDSTGEPDHEKIVILEQELQDTFKREYRLLCSCLEFFQLTQQLSELHSGFSALQSNIAECEYDEDSGYFFSKTQRFLNQYFEIIKLFAPDSDSETHKQGLEILENILRSTAVLLSNHDLVPKTETEVNRFMEPFIKAAFPTAVYNPSVPSVLKEYHPEFGIPELKVLIEYKFADNETELKTCLDGVLTDTRGYSGDAQWKCFFAVFYLTGAFSIEKRVKAHFEQCGVSDSWKIIVLNGAGSRKKKNTPPASEVATVTPATPPPA